MKFEYVNLFIDAVNIAMNTMIGQPPSRLKPFFKKGRTTIADSINLIVIYNNLTQIN